MNIESFIIIIIVIIIIIIINISQIDGALARNYLGLDIRLIIRKEIISTKFITPQGVFLHVFTCNHAHRGVNK